MNIYILIGLYFFKGIKINMSNKPPAILNKLDEALYKYPSGSESEKRLLTFIREIAIMKKAPPIN
jgi:hypothetical protein